MKNAALFGSKNAPLTGDQMWDRAKRYEREIEDEIIPIWNRKATPSRTSDVDECFENLRKHYYWLSTKVAKWKTKEAENPGVHPEPNIQNCPKDWSNVEFAAFKLLYKGEMMHKLVEPNPTAPDGKSRSKTVNRKR